MLTEKDVFGVFASWQCFSLGLDDQQELHRTALQSDTKWPIREGLGSRIIGEFVQVDRSNRVFSRNGIGLSHLLGFVALVGLLALDQRQICYSSWWTCRRGRRCCQRSSCDGGKQSADQTGPEWGGRIQHVQQQWHTGWNTGQWIRGAGIHE